MNKSIRNITFHRLFFILLSLLPLRAWALGENTSYVLDESAEKSLSTIATGASMALSGPGLTLTFEAKKSSVLAVNYFYVEKSTDGGSSWTEMANPSLTTSYKTYTYTISTDVTHIRFITKTGATLRKYYKNVKITRAITFSTSETFTTPIDFGTVTNRKSKELPALVDYNNTTYNQQVTGSCTDPNFTVTTTTVGATGEEEEIPITFTPTSAGTHTGTVTLTMNGKQVTFSVTGVGQTTYYGRALASATTGGSAYVSFTSFDAATSTSATTNSGVTTASKGTSTVYYRAVVNPRYEFLGWKRNLSDATYVSTDADFQTTIDYTSETYSSPTEVTYYAVFEEKPSLVILDPTQTGYDLDVYETVTLSRTLPVGYSTLSLPFDTNVATLTGRTSDDDWVAQLHTVAYNQHDDYTLYFQKVADGSIHAFQPYVLHLGQQVVNPSWSNITLTEAQSVSITPQKGYDGYDQWTMTSNFTAAFDMEGRYGIVNTAGGLQRGGTGSKLNAYTAYITPPAVGGNAPRLRVAYMEPDGVTAIDSLPTDTAEPVSAPSAIYGPDGTLRSRLMPGLNIVRQPDGSVRKIYIEH